MIELSELIKKRPDIKDWAFYDFVSCYLILCNILNQKRDKQLIFELKEKQLPNGSWYNNPITTIVASIAAHLYDEKESFERGFLYLESLQQEDGGLSYCEIPVWDTALNLVAIGPDRRITFLEDAGNYLMNTRNADGGWGFYPHLESENDTTAVALMAMNLHGMEADTEKSIDYLKRAQLDNGLWPVWRKTEVPSIEVVAHIVTALDISGVDPEITARSKKWLLGKLVSGEVHSAEWSINKPYSYFSVLEALRNEKEMTPRIVSLIRQKQLNNGAYSLDMKSGKPSPTATANAVLALSLFGNEFREEILKGLIYLHDSMNGDNTWDAEKEVLGPRPLRYSIQASTHAFCNRALFLGRKYL